MMWKLTISNGTIRYIAGILLVAVGGVIYWAVSPESHPSQTATLQAAEPKGTPLPPQELFTHWPDPAKQKPDLVLVITGQTYGYLQKCGCSYPQKGGLERRYNFIKSLEARGWDVAAIDIGDVPKPLPYTPTREQTITKYATAMQAMKMMNYRVTGVGYEELAGPLLEMLAKYSLQPGNELPKVINSNIANPKDFEGFSGPMIRPAEILKAKSGLTVGITSVIGQKVIEKNPDNSVKFAERTDLELNKVLAQWKKDGDPMIKILLYSGPFDHVDPTTNKRVDAQAAAELFPDFNVIVSQTAESEPPSLPKEVNNKRTMILQVGQRGQNVGVVGIYQTKTGIQMYYQKVAMAEEFATPADKTKDHPILNLLQDYSDTVKKQDYLSQMASRKKLHPVQAQNPTAKYAGDQTCVQCHANEHAIWSKSKHAHAYEALEKIAAFPTGRNFDGECIICHTVGYAYRSGYLNAEKTPTLKNVQCESCHGPASLHVTEEIENLKKANPTHAMKKSLTPWKTGGQGHLPSPEKLAAYAAEPDQKKREAMLTVQENEVMSRVFQVCFGCHDSDNDPKFKLEDYWKTINHTGFLKGPAKK
ncbi:MAG: multiheme c-type cytochrome [Zavarzinella sp.]